MVLSVCVADLAGVLKSAVTHTYLLQGADMQTDNAILHRVL